MAAALRDADSERLAYVLSLATVTAATSRDEGEAGSARAMRDAAARRAVWLSQLVAFVEADAAAQAQLFEVYAGVLAAGDLAFKEGAGGNNAARADGASVL